MMTGPMKVAGSAVLFAAFATSLNAQQPDTIYRVGEVVVKAARPVTTIGGSSAIEARLDSLDLPPAASVETVFRALPLLHVRTNSRGESEISARGSESRQVAVLVDGVPLTLAWDSRADVSVLPATGIQEITFVRGLSSMLFGPNVLGGVVEVGVGQSHFQPAQHRATFEAGLDHIGGYGGAATIAVPGSSANGEWLIRAGASFRDSPGQPLAHDVREPVATDDDLRLNTDAQSVNGFLSARYATLGGAWLAFSGSSFQSERGIAAELGVENARFWRYPHVSRTLAVLSGGTGDRASPFGGRGDMEFSLGYDAGRTEIDAFTSRAYSETSGFENGDDRTLTARLLADQTLGERGDLRAAFTLSEIRHDEQLPEGDARYRQRLMSFGAENNWRLIDGGKFINSLRLSVGGAFDVANTPESGGREPRQGQLEQWGGRLGLTAAVNGGHTVLHGGVSQRARFPALREMYSGALNRFQPNPNLRPERLLAMEAGVTTQLGNGQVQAVGFRHQLRDAVVRITLPDRKFLRVNRNELLSTGVELLASQRIGPVDLTGNLTVQSVDLTDTDAGVTNRPENLPEVFGTLDAQFPLLFDVSGSAQIDYIGNQYCIDPGTGNDTNLAAGTVTNLGVARTWSVRTRGASWFSRIETRIAADNVGNVARYDQCGLPQPGRLLRFQIRLF